jgi:hypothetical protein
MLRFTRHPRRTSPDDKVEEGDFRRLQGGHPRGDRGQMGEYYELASGFYIKKPTVEVLESETPSSTPSAASPPGRRARRALYPRRAPGCLHYLRTTRAIPA